MPSDVLARNKISDPALLHKIVLFLADNIGSITSPNRIGTFLTHEGNLEAGKGNSPASRTIENYIVDTGMRNMLLGYRDVDRGHILENVIDFLLEKNGNQETIF